MEWNIRFRKRFYPRTFADACAVAFICGAIPTVFCFEVFVVLPTLFDWGLYMFHAIAGTFILLNIIGNFVATIFVDTSCDGVLLPSQVPSGWHVCAQCDIVAPPRSRHCNTCNVCILKREHHCVFTGCCIGCHNHRFFFFFLAYMWLATLYSSGLNSFFIWPFVGGFSLNAVSRLLIPGFWLVWEPCISNLFAFFYSVILIGCLFMSILVYYYSGLILNNETTQETNDPKKKNQFDHGTLHNIEVVFGSQWMWTWILPCIRSPLIYDGFDWSTKSEVKFVHNKSS